MTISSAFHLPRRLPGRNTPAAPPPARQPAEVAPPDIPAGLAELSGLQATERVSADERFLDVVVLVCVVLFILLAVGIGVLALQATSVSWPY